VFTLIVDVVAPVLHENAVAGPPTVTEAVSVAELPEHTAVLFTVTVGGVHPASPASKSLKLPSPVAWIVRLPGELFVIELVVETQVEGSNFLRI